MCQQVQSGLTMNGKSVSDYNATTKAFTEQEYRQRTKRGSVDHSRACRNNPGRCGRLPIDKELASRHRIDRLADLLISTAALFSHHTLTGAGILGNPPHAAFQAVLHSARGRRGEPACRRGYRRSLQRLVRSLSWTDRYPSDQRELNTNDHIPKNSNDIHMSP